jgi:hypothetical protein
LSQPAPDKPVSDSETLASFGMASSGQRFDRWKFTSNFSGPARACYLHNIPQAILCNILNNNACI